MTEEPGTVEEETETEPTLPPHMKYKPENGGYAYVPFNTAETGSEHFRIPALVTKGEKLIAAADARWNTTKDGFGLDTIVARSTNNGDTWKYTFANYLGDNGNEYNENSTAFIDPALAVDGDTVYMLVDLFPAGQDINRVQKGTGFDDEGHLLLKKSDGYTYDYYVGDFEEGYAPVLTKDGAETGYKVDEYYNLYGGAETSNVFFADADFQVYPTSYLYLTTSSNGREWSAPQLLDLKGDNESFYGVGPGRGLVTSSGTIMFPCYVYDGQGGQRSSIIYSIDGGDSWTRTDDVPNTQGWSSESQLVELDDDGTIRCFFRNSWGTICYADYDGASWSESVSTGISVESNCQISAITYSETINGKQAILLSCPSASGRANGKIYVMLVNDDKSMRELRAFDVTTDGNYFGYSCLTEMEDGRIAILYEGDSNFGNLSFERYAIEDVAGWDAAIGDNVKKTDNDSGVTVSAPGLEEIRVTSNETVAALEGKNRPYVAYDFTLTANGGQNYTEPALVYIPAEQIADLENPKGFVVDGTGEITEIDGYYTADKEYFVFEMPHFSTGGAVGDEVDPLTNYSKEVTINLVEGGSDTITLSGDVEDQVLTEGLLDTGVATVDVTVNTVSGDPYEEMTPVTDVISGQAYYIRNKDGQYLNSSAKWVDDVDSAAQWTWDGNYLYQKSGWNNTTYLTCSSSGVGSSTWNAAEWTVDNGTFTGTYSEWVSEGWFGGHWETYPYTLGQAYTTRTVTPEGSQQTVITVTAQGVGDTYFAVGEAPDGTLYHVVVSEKPPVEENGYLVGPERNGNNYYNPAPQVTKLITTVGTSYTLYVPSDVTDSVTWESDDDHIATVNHGTITGVSQGPTTVTATVMENGSPVATYTIPVQVWDNGAGAGEDLKITDIYIDDITATTAYYNLNCTTDLVETKQGELFYLEYPVDSHMAIDFFGKPDNGYALTFMSATNSAGDYLALSGNSPQDTEFYSTAGAAGANQRKYFGDTKVADMVQAAMNLNCDGALGFTRRGIYHNYASNEHYYEGDGAIIESNLTFHSEQLPTVTKEVVSVNGNAYTPEMIAKVGDKVRFEITVTQHGYMHPEDADRKETGRADLITYSSVTLKDNLRGAAFVNGYSGDTVYPSLNGFDSSTDWTVTYYVEYTIQDSDLDTTITNTADLTYTYQSKYSSGSFSGRAEAKASISAKTFNPASIVVDFGLPVELDFSGEKHGQHDLVRGTAEYGTVSVDDNNVVTYTPDTVLTGVDTVTLYNEKDAEYRFNVYPATTVYYEEGFATAEKGFTGGSPSKGTDSQAMSVTGSKNHYGYDDKYQKEATGPSNNTQMVSKNGGDYVTFDFTGTGVEIYANCTPSSGTVMIQVYRGSKLIKTLMVDTAMKDGYSEATNFQSVNGYNVPIASLLDLSTSPEDYTVKITNVENKEGYVGTVSLDGFRVHGTLGNNDSVYMQDGEADPTFVQLRDAVLADLGKVTAGTSQQYADQIAANVMSQVYASGHATSVVVFEQNGAGIEVGKDLLDFGPKNELYLKAGQTVTFTLGTKAQIGLKALNANVKYSIRSEDATITSSTDMFTKTYDAGSVTISNISGGVLAITQIKAVKDTPTAAAQANTLVLQPLTADDLMPALVAIGYEESDEED